MYFTLQVVAFLQPQNGKKLFSLFSETVKKIAISFSRDRYQNTARQIYLFITC